MPKAGDVREDEKGRKFVWKVPSGGEEGWWSQIEDKEFTENRIPWTCPCCKELLDEWSVSYFNRWGECANCYYDFLAGRNNLPNFASNKERASYCIQKKGEKSKKEVITP